MITNAFGAPRKPIPLWEVTQAVNMSSRKSNISFMYIPAFEVQERAAITILRIGEIQQADDDAYRSHSAEKLKKKRRGPFGIYEFFRGGPAEEPTPDEVEAFIKREANKGMFPTWVNYPSKTSDQWRRRAKELLKAAVSDPSRDMLVSVADFTGTLSGWGQDE